MLTTVTGLSSPLDMLMTLPPWLLLVQTVLSRHVIPWVIIYERYRSFGTVPS